MLEKEQSRQRAEHHNDPRWRSASCVQGIGIKANVHVGKGKVGHSESEKGGWGQILQDFVGPAEEFGFYLMCSGKLLNVFKKSGMNCIIILKDDSGCGVENELEEVTVWRWRGN